MDLKCCNISCKATQNVTYRPVDKKNLCETCEWGDFLIIPKNNVNIFYGITYNDLKIASAMDLIKSFTTYSANKKKWVTYYYEKDIAKLAHSIGYKSERVLHSRSQYKKYTKQLREIVFPSIQLNKLRNADLKSASQIKLKVDPKLIKNTHYKSNICTSSKLNRSYQSSSNNKSNQSRYKSYQSPSNNKSNQSKYKSYQFSSNNKSRYKSNQSSLNKSNQSSLNKSKYKTNSNIYKSTQSIPNKSRYKSTQSIKYKLNQLTSNKSKYKSTKYKLHQLTSDKSRYKSTKYKLHQLTSDRSGYKSPKYKLHQLTSDKSGYKSKQLTLDKYGKNIIRLKIDPKLVDSYKIIKLKS
jgi:hypothetical protein